jgi:hypothetical protein
MALGRVALHTLPLHLFLSTVLLMGAFRLPHLRDALALANISASASRTRRTKLRVTNGGRQTTARNIV